MPGPAPAGLIIYAKAPDRLAAFYEALLGMTRLHATAERVVIESPDLQLVIHAMPPEAAASVRIESPPQHRRSALKFFFTVPSLAVAGELAATLGGEVLSEEWQGPGFRVRNAIDPEGNVFHLREPLARGSAT